MSEPTNPHTPENPDRIDYRETSDITEVHAAIQREHTEPTANVTPVPLWLSAVCGAAMVWAGTYFGIFNGGLSGNIFNEYESSPAALFPNPRKVAGGGLSAEAALSLAQAGKAVFSNCQACHQTTGLGVAGQFPMLAGSEWVKGGEKRLLAILLKGVVGPITVLGKTGSYAGNMVGWETTLSSKKIAAVASYVRSEWGNGAPEINEADVELAKKEFAEQKTQWTEALLLQIADENYEGASAAPAPAPAAKAATPAAPSATPGGASTDQLAAGKAAYMMICIACHQPTGTGLPMVFPPLTKSPYANGSAERFAAIILKGNIGAFIVDGKPFNNVMPGQEMMLSDEKIAAAMTFVRANFGNSAPPVAAEIVAAARKKFTERKTPWTQPELDAWKE